MGTTNKLDNSAARARNVVSRHQDPVGHLLLRPDPRRRAGEPRRGHHRREDGGLHQEPAGRPRRRRLRHREGRQGQRLPDRHGLLRRRQHRVRQVVHPQARPVLRRRQAATEGRRGRDRVRRHPVRAIAPALSWPGLAEDLG